VYKNSLFSTIALILLAGCNVAAFIHYLVIVENPRTLPKEKVLLTFAVYFISEGFIVPAIVILSVENLRNFLKIKITKIWEKMKNVFAHSFICSTAKVEPLV
jgi:hypothetical protein